MKITLEADYALRIMYQLADASVNTQNPIRDSKILSDEACIPLRFTLKILRKLSEKLLVKSYKGSNGGYTLAKDASEITLKEIIESIDEPVYISRCVDSQYCCSKNNMNKSICIFHNIFGNLNEYISEKLNNITLKTVVSKETSVEEILKSSEPV